MSTDASRPLPLRPRNALLALLIVLAVLLLILFRPEWPWRVRGADEDAEPRAVTPRGDLAADEKTTIEIFRQASPSVVYITTVAVRQNVITLDIMQIPKGMGSGTVWDQDGHVVTNYHVIQDADDFRVTLADHSTWKARLVGKYAEEDLAVLRIDAPNERLHPIPIGESSNLQVGQKVYAIGNPFGLDQTLTTGVISALGREIKAITGTPIEDVIQTDAAINRGNSGGPLLDSAGRLIGMNTAILSPSGTYAGIGFAIPVDEINRVVPQLIRHGKIMRPGLGVRIANDSIAADLKLKGALILFIQPDGPAAKAGLRPTRRTPAGIQLGDVIVGIDNHKITSTKDLFNALDKYKIGDKVNVTVLRDGKEKEFEVTLESIS